MKSFISQRESLNEHGELIDSLESKYIYYFESFGLYIQPTSNFSDHDIDEDTQFIILTGGGAAPRKYFLHPHNEYEQSQRNQKEQQLIDKSIELNIPMIAICRGFQVLNGYLGGKLEKLNFKVNRPINTDHPVTLGEKKIIVNNYHNDGVPIELLAPSLNIISLDEDNNHVEAFYHKQYRWLGLLWHPEREIEDAYSKNAVDKLIREFIQNRGVINESYYSRSGPRD